MSGEIANLEDYNKRKEHIEVQLRSFNRHQICQFSWLCSVISLPVLSAKRGFTYWEPSDRQKHLYSVFFCLDLCAYFAFQAVHPSSIVSVALGSISSAIDAFNTTPSKAASATLSAIKSAYYTTKAVLTSSTEIFNSAVSVYAADAAYHTDTAYAYACNTIYYYTERVATEIIKAIQKKEPLNLGSSIYTNISLWSEFQEDLRKLNCGYWANLYMDLFNSNFTIDFKLLERRISVPESVRLLGARDVAAFLSGESKRLNEARIIILGEKGAGKTSLARKLVDPESELPRVEESTEGVDVLQWKLNENMLTEGINVRIWDFAGHVITHAAHRYFLGERCFYIIVYDGRSEHRNDIEKWLNHAKNYGGDSPVFVLVNVHDDSPVAIDENKLLDDFPQLIRFDHFSLQLDNDSVAGYRDMLDKRIRTDPAWDARIPSKWFNMKNKLEECFISQGAELIKTKDFNEIAQKLDISKRDVEPMKRSLNALGVCLWYGKIPELQTFVLNPNWISYGVYKIINWLGKRVGHKRYTLYLGDFECIFSTEIDKKRYPIERHEFLFNLMKTYELAYPMKDATDGLVLPSMLPELQPERQMENAYTIRFSLLMRYRVNGTIPLDTITRFIVRHYIEIVEKNDVQVAWRKGVALRDEFGNDALVIEDGSEIRVSVKGRSALLFLNSIRDTLNEIFSGYKSENPEMEYVITETAQHKLVYASDGKIMAYAINDRLYLEEKTGKEINMSDIAKQHNITNSTIINGDFTAINSSISMNVTNLFKSLPKSIDGETFSQVLETLEKFLDSKEGENLTVKESKSLKSSINVARKDGNRKGWQKLRTFLADSANIATISSIFYAFITAHPGITLSIKSFFGL